VWMERGLPRPRATIAVAVAGSVALAATVPYERFIGVSSTADTLMTLPLWSLSNWFTIPLENLRWVVAAVALAFALAAALLPRRVRIVLPLLVLALYIAVVQPVDARTRKAAVGALFQGIGNPDRDWIDAAVGTDATVGALWSGRNDRLTINENEFFNRSVGPVYHLREPVPGNLAETALRVDHATGYLVDPQGRRVRVAYVLADTSLPLAGETVAEDKERGLVVLRQRGPLRVRYVADGVADDGWAGAAFAVRGFDRGCRSVAVRLGSDPKLFHRPQVVRALVGGRVVASARVPPDRERTLRVPACRVQFRVDRTAVPADVEPGSGDTRRLGIRVTALGVR